MLVNAGAITPLGRMVLSVSDALAHIRQEAERGELTFADAPLEQVAWMFHSCAAPAVPRELDGARPESLFPSLQTEGFTEPGHGGPQTPAPALGLPPSAMSGARRRLL